MPQSPQKLPSVYANNNLLEGFFKGMANQSNNQVSNVSSMPVANPNNNYVMDYLKNGSSGQGTPITSNPSTNMQGYGFFNRPQTYQNMNNGSI